LIQTFNNNQRKTRDSGFFTPESVEFQEKILRRAGVGEETYFPPGIMSEPPVLTMQSAREEAEYVLASCMEELMRRTKIAPKDIDILIVNCSLFNPTPSLSAMVHFLPPALFHFFFSISVLQLPF